MGPARRLRAILEERLALMAPSRRLRLAEADRLLTAWAAGRTIRLLDAGCGDGILSLSLAKRHPEWTITGVDLRDDLLAGARERASARGLRNVRFQAADLLKPLQVGGFDAVAALECLSEIPDDEAALRTMRSALRPGGALVAQVPDRDWKPVLPGSATEWREQVRQGYGSDGLARLLAAAGFESARLSPTYRSLAAAAQELRDRIKDRGLALRLLVFPFLAAAVWLERRGLTWGRSNAILFVCRRPDH
ncbi:MAG TPA: methyltransferase domain-containing protein [Solirubrobacterales bacterium]|jgi:SAM-dependent methyltransferase|nr:methyltransferase domain-containing protein [Solirubrobacterales bacterium]